MNLPCGDEKQRDVGVLGDAGGPQASCVRQKQREVLSSRADTAVT